MVKRFRSTVCVMDVDKQQIRTELTPGKLDNIKISLGQTPGKLMRKLQLKKGISYVSVHQDVRHHLKFYPYRLQSVQELCPRDQGKRLQFCVWFRRFIRNNKKLKNVYFSNEA
ncbi:hypothetical protein NPIL_348971 [Nephila pilipes]|uniref:Uncharacterized protein n=1 Tax=Nephila pilipes TaxID=299642 RepID=A0A8X6TJ20_NEPPI|nr:hypothetical protein NPIL_348971 [Nephila pilipes]